MGEMSSRKRSRSDSLKEKTTAIKREISYQKRKLAHQRKPQKQKQKRIVEFLIEHKQYYPIFDRICSYLGIEEIVCLTRTCRKLSGLYRVLLMTQWNVDRALCRFVDHPQNFRSQLGRHDALIAGGLLSNSSNVWSGLILVLMSSSKPKGFQKQMYLCQLLENTSARQNVTALRSALLV